MSLPTAPLGDTGMELTRVGFGAWAVGGGGWKFGWGEQSDADSVAALHHAVESGINWIDTAPVYGLGRSEEVVGQALHEIAESDRPFVFTKCGLTFDRRRPDDGPFNVLAAESVRRELEDSLRRLRLEAVDLYQVHWPPQDGTSLDEYWATMADLKREGKVRAIGLSNHDLNEVVAAEAIAHVDSLQPPLSLVRREAADELIPRCAEQRTGVIVYSPMQSGLLTGTMSVERVAALAEDDWRRENDDFRGENLVRNLSLAEALRPIAGRHEVSVGAVAVAWTLHCSGVTGAIVGARSPAQVDGWLPAAGLALTDDDLDAIAGAIASVSSPRR